MSAFADGRNVTAIGSSTDYAYNPLNQMTAFDPDTGTSGDQTTLFYHPPRARRRAN